MFLGTSVVETQRFIKIEERLAAAEEHIAQLTEVNQVMAQTLAKNAASFIEAAEANHYIIEQIEQIHDIFISAGIVSPLSKIGYIARINNLSEDDQGPVN